MKKQSLITILLTVLMSMVGVIVFAHNIEVKNDDGVTIYYNYINDGMELQVTSKNNVYGSYSGNVNIPEEVIYMNRIRKVTSICWSAFAGCKNLTSVTIPNSVTQIGDRAFQECSSLTSITIPNSVTDLGFSAFAYDYNLISVNIPTNLTSIPDYTFYECGSLTTIIIPNGVTSIGLSAFERCRSLTSVTIPNSITIIGTFAFNQCNNLTAVHISDIASWCSVKFADRSSNPLYCSGNLYLNDKEVKDLTIPNNVHSIGNYAFIGCSDLITLAIPNSVTSIGDEAFYGCKNLTSIISLIENPFSLKGNRTFDLDVFNNSTLYVPVGTIEKYKATDGWKNFLFIEEGSGPNGGNTPEIKKCDTPTIGYQNGKLTFYSETEGAICQYSITDEDIKAGNSNEVQLGVTYHISVYATKAGYDNSDVTTATLCWIDIEPKMEGITNNVTNVRTRAVLIQSNGNLLTISGADEGTDIIVYDITGKNVGLARVTSDVTTINTSLRSGDIGIVKIGEKAIKVITK